MEAVATLSEAIVLDRPVAAGRRLRAVPADDPNEERLSR